MSSIESEMTARGVFKGMHGLEGLVNAREFWDRQAYGTRLYYGDGMTDYLHHSVLKTAVEAISELSTLRAENERLRGALVEGRRAIGGHDAPNDCYATGPRTGDVYRDLVECPACIFIATLDAIDQARAALQERG